jgi:poly(beta-D-mannuronate) lyase
MTNCNRQAIASEILRMLSLLAIGVSTPLLAAEVHVASPADLERAAQRLQPGDVVVFANGNWRDVDLLLQAKGTEQDPIAFKAQTPGRMVVSGKSRMRIAGEHLIVEGLFFHQAWHEDDLISFRGDEKALAKNCRLTNCAVVDCNRPGEHRETHWLSLYGSGHQVDHCKLSGKLSPGTTCVVWLGAESGRHQIDHNFFGPRPPLGKNGGETLRVGDSKTSLQSAGCVAEFNLFEECDGEAEIISNKSCDNVYRYNTFHRCSGALTLRHGNNCTVAGNFFLGAGVRGTGGVRIVGVGHRVYNNYFADLTGDDQRAALCLMNGLRNSPANGYVQVQSALVAFNTFVNCKVPVIVGLTDKDAGNHLPPEGCTFADNLFFIKGDVVDIRTKPLNCTWEGNLADRRGNVPPFSGFKSANTELRETTDRLWRPDVRSQAIHAAVGRFPEINDDIDGQPRGERPDVGCDQVLSSPPLRKPLEPRDVGPDWK